MRISLGRGGEFDLIRELLEGEEPLPSIVRVGPGDDCLVLEDGMVVSADLTVEGVHFRRDWITLREAGYRAAAAGLSDLAAMAAQPVGVLLSMAVGPENPSTEARALQQGAREACRGEGVPILGGDLAASPGPVVLDVVVLGRAEEPVLRAGSLPGDEVWVTGWLGGAAGAVQQWRRGGLPPESLRSAFARPRPRIREARWLAARVPLHAMLDLSDGLAGDAGHLAAASELAFVLRAEALPVHPELRRAAEDSALALHLALAGGEDYELCMTVPGGVLEEWIGPFQEAFGIPLTRVGEVREGSGVFLEGADGRTSPLEEGGFSHFHGREPE